MVRRIGGNRIIDNNIMKYTILRDAVNLKQSSRLLSAWMVKKKEIIHPPPRLILLPIVILKFVVYAQRVDRAGVETLLNIIIASILKYNIIADVILYILLIFLTQYYNVDDVNKRKV